jgi:hypothetical protein
LNLHRPRSDVLQFQTPTTPLGDLLASQDAFVAFPT